MFTDLRRFSALLRSHGARWLFFRLVYALRKRSGSLRARMPAYRWQDRPLAVWLGGHVPAAPDAYARWRREHAPPFFFKPLNAGPRLQTAVIEKSWSPQGAVEEAGRILQGDIRFFAHEFVRTGFPPDWHRDPVSGTSLPRDRHWSEIREAGDADIKFIWEPSRFGTVYPLMRAYAWTRDERFAEAFWQLVESWADANPPNTGPNWMDGQEAALRLMAWTFGGYAFLESPSTTPGRLAQLTVLVAAHAQRIYRNVGYAISTRSNHAISEAFGLWLAGLLFPELKDAPRYRAFGQRLLEQEAEAQIFPDGSYAMYSMNYHRFVLHLYLCALRLAEVNKSPFSEIVHERVVASVEFLAGLIDPASGRMPLYGSNDGALVLPLNSCDFTDYRPLLQLGAYVTRQRFLFRPGPWDEDIFWLYGARAVPRAGMQPESKPGSKAPAASQAGGLYTLHGSHSRAILYCARRVPVLSRPSHADQLHMDLWLHGQEVVCDAGTFLYSGEGAWRNGLAHTRTHNTVTVDGTDQMEMLTRFTWTDWSTGRVVHHDAQAWQGEHDGYHRLSDPVHHRRTVRWLGEDRWLVIDRLEARRSHRYALHWLLRDVPYEQEGHSLLLALEPLAYRVQVGVLKGPAAFSIARADPGGTRGWRSRYYGDREPALSVVLEADQAETCFWSFFGPSGDSIELRGTVLHVASVGGDLQIDLAVGT